MIDLQLWQSIIHFIDTYKKQNNTEGILICGSLTKGKLRPGSDIDILILQERVGFEMELLKADRFPIDRLQARPSVLISILKEQTELSNVLSLSFASSNLIIEDSPGLREIISLAQQNIEERKLSYMAPQNKKPHIVDGAILTVSSTQEGYKLIKDGEIVL